MDTVAAGLTPGHNRPQSSEPAVVGHASSVGLRKVPLLLEAIEVAGECRIERGEVRLLNRIQESVRGDRPVARIDDGGADDPNWSSVPATHVLIPFGTASVGFELVVQLIGRLDDRRSVQAQSILGRQARKYLPAFRAVNGVAIGGESPILPELGCGDAGHRKTRPAPGTHGPARRERKGPVGQPLLQRGVGLEVAYDVHHLDVACVGDAGEEILVQQKGDDGDEVCRRSRAIIDIAAGGGQDAHILAGWIVGAASRVVHPVGLEAARGRTKLAEKPEALGSYRVQLSDVDAVRGIEGIIEIARRMVEVLARIHAGSRGLCEGAGSGRKQQGQRREGEKEVLLCSLHWLILLYSNMSAATKPRCGMTNSQPRCLRAAARDLCRVEAPTRWIRR